MTETEQDYQTLLDQRVTDPQRLALLEEGGMMELEVSIALDRLTRIACKLINAPVSLISMVGRDFQFFKSAHGLGELMPEGPADATVAFLLPACGCEWSTFCRRGRARTSPRKGQLCDRGN